MDIENKIGVLLVDDSPKQRQGDESHPLPRVEGAAVMPASRTAPVLAQPKGTETILLAEDDPMVRNFVCATLEMRGYTALTAEDGESALAIGANNQGVIHLLLTDILMPGMNGRELAVKFKQQRPQSPVIFMSGYTDQVIVEQDLLEEGALFIQKPFSPSQLSEFVREALEGKVQA